MISLKSIALSLLLAYVAIGGLSAENILFFGNSFTYGGEVKEVKAHGGVPQLVEIIALSQKKKIYTEMLTASGKNWAYHLANPASDTMLKSQSWDDVVIQDYSTEPTRVGNIADFMKTGTEFYDRVALESPKTRLVLFETWARGAGHKLYKPNQPTAKSFSGPDEMYAEIHRSYDQLRISLQARKAGLTVIVAPVGTAFSQCLKTYPQINLYASDRYHASPAGSYLAALVIYATIFHDTPIGATAKLPGFELTPEIAKDLQTIAHDVTAKK